jgi:tRNA pseudouridine55 synthase
MDPTSRVPTDGGLLLVDKQEGPTSHDVVARARTAVGLRRIGHAGTLDPFATGLLLLLVGRATRLVQYFHRLDKRYTGSLMLGVETDTHDHTGDVSGHSEDWRQVSERHVREVLRSYTGRMLQRPPAFSAKQVAGRRAHRSARAGEDVRLVPVPVTVSRLELTGYRPPVVEIETEVSTGTYVRALARDLGRALGCGAHLTALRRTAIGPFTVADAWAADRLAGVTLERPHWCSPGEAVDWLPQRQLDGSELADVREGRRIPADAILWPSERFGAAEDDAAVPVALMAGDRLIAIAERRETELQPRKVLSRD